MIVYHLALANMKMILRDRQALFWALAFPLMFVLVFGLFFRDVDSPQVIGVVDNAGDEMSRGLVRSLSEMGGLVVEMREDEAEARRQVEDGDLGHLLIIPEGLAQTASTNPPARLTLVFDESNTFGGIVVGAVSSFVDGANLELARAPVRLALEVRGAGASEPSDDFNYIDYLLPGLAVWGVMSFSIIGLATTIAVYREKRILIRIQSTPLKVRVFVTSQVLASLLLSIVQAAIILAVGMAIFRVPIPLSQAPQLCLLVLMGNLVFLNLGFIIGAFSKTVAAASGLGNAVSLPLMFLSGVFFPTDSLPAVLLFVIEYLPLAPLLEMFRSVALDSGVFWDYPTQLAIVAGWIVLSAAVAMRTFRFR